MLSSHGIAKASRHIRPEAYCTPDRNDASSQAAGGVRATPSTQGCQGESSASSSPTEEGPADHAAREGIQHYGQIHKLGSQANVGDVGDPKLVDSRRGEVASQVRVNRQTVSRIGRRDHEGAPAYAQQIVLPHHPQHTLVIDRETLPLQFRRNSAVSVRRRFQSGFLHLIAQFHFHWRSLARHPPAIETSPAHAGHLTNTAQSRLGLSPRLAQFLQTGIHATDDGRRVMILEMLQGVFKKILAPVNARTVFPCQETPLPLSRAILRASAPPVSAQVTFPRNFRRR